MAPEQLEGKEADARSDLFSFGAVLYEMLTGRRAFEGTSSASVISAVMSGQPPPLSALQPLASPALERVVTQCLAKNPDDRWQTAHDLAEELRWIARQTGTANTGATPRPVRSLHRWAMAAALALVGLVAAAAALWQSGLWRPAPGGSAKPAITFIAVLPLENLSGDASQEYFADGLTDSLINELAQIRSLRVVARTSVMRFKGNRRPVSEVARDLNNVGAVVEGTVMREKDRVAVTVQLIDTASDVHLWSKSYDRDITDILALRREIARSVATEIRAAIAPDEERRLQRSEKVKPAALDAYLKATQARNRGSSATNLRAARESALTAAGLEPGFAPAWVEVAMANSLLRWWFIDRSPDLVTEARSAAENALRLDPSLPEGHRAKGVVFYQLDRDYERALKEFALALERNPSDTDSLAYIGYVKRRQGRLDEAQRHIEQALLTNPLSASLFFNLGQTEMLLRQTHRAERDFDDALRINSAYGQAIAHKLRSRLRLRPDLSGAHGVEREAAAAGVAEESGVLYHRVLLHIFAGDYVEALRLLDSCAVDAFEYQLWFVPRALLQAQVHDLLGERVKARQRYAEARGVLEARLSAEPGEAVYRSPLGLALSGLGDKTAAIREGRAAVAAMPVSKEAFDGPYRLEDLARIYAAVGERDAAVELLRQLLAMPFDLAAPALRIDPAWAPLRGHPGFERLIASSKRP
jgi:TolB-like protein